MMDRIIKAFTFRKEVYAEVENDAAFTPTAWMIVAVTALLSQLGSNAAVSSVVGGGWLLGALGSTIFAIGGFALGAFVISFVGQKLFNAEVTFEEMVRTLGLAYVWNAIGFLGILALLGRALACITGPIQLLAGLAGLAAFFVAAKEALDLEWGNTIITVLIGWVAMMIVMAIAGAIMAGLGLAAAGVGGLLGGF